MGIDLKISNHICDRYIQRFNPALLSVTDPKGRYSLAKKAIMISFRESRYVSDNENGILFFNRDLKCHLIVKNRALITIYQRDKKIHQREQKAGVAK